MITDVAVVIPAADEQDEIAGCLRSVRAAIDELQRVRPATRAHVVVVLDACVDGTAAEVARFDEVLPVLSAARCVGSARRLGTEYALDRFPVRHLLLANTDADCRVPLDWLTHLVTEVERGADLVLGTVRPREGLPPAVAEAWQRAHDLGDGHHHVHGANLAITAAAYAHAGGWHDLPVHEDVDLVQRAIAAQRHIVRSGRAAVLTSSRLEGRTPAGFAAHLRALQHATQPALDGRAS